MVEFKTINHDLLKRYKKYYGIDDISLLIWANWQQLSSPSYNKLCSPLNIKWRNNMGILRLRSRHAGNNIEILHKKNLIIKDINLFCGYQLITDIQIIGNNYKVI